MGTLNPSAFQYGGKRFIFTAILSWDQNDPSKSTALDNNHINSFYYQNEINQLYLTGYIEYTDVRGEIDKIFDKQFSYCEINLQEITVESDKDYAIETPSKKQHLYHNFYVNSVQILNRSLNEIKYRINIVSSHWFQCISKIEYSNYATGKEDIVDIIRNILHYVNLQANPHTFDIVKSGVQLNFVSDINDNAITAIGYLLDKMYFYRDRIPQLQYIIYNEHTNKYEMFDVTNENTWFNMYAIPVTFFKNQIENLTVPEPANFASVVKFPRSSLHTMINNVKYYDFDISKNNIIDETIGNKTIQNFYNNFYNTGEYKPNIDGLYRNVTFEPIYNRYSTYWNNTNNRVNINLYDEVMRNYTDGNSLVINTVADILRKPGCLMNVSIDRDVKNDTGDDDNDDTQAYLNKYTAYEGRWFITKVQNFLDLRQMRFTQNIICCRNFIKKPGTTCCNK